MSWTVSGYVKRQHSWGSLPMVLSHLSLLFLVDSPGYPPCCSPVHPSISNCADSTDCFDWHSWRTSWCGSFSKRSPPRRFGCSSTTALGYRCPISETTEISGCLQVGSGSSLCQSSDWRSQLHSPTWSHHSWSSFAAANCHWSFLKGKGSCCAHQFGLLWSLVSWSSDELLWCHYCWKK